MKVAVGYCRVSTADQASDGVSPEAQREKIRAWATLNGHELLHIFDDDGVSGKSTHNRPGVKQACELALERQAVLVVYSLSRFSRSTVDTITTIDRLRAAGVEFVSLTEQIDTTTAMGRAFYKIIAVLAELEREQVGERTRMALDYKRSRGEALGNTPYGFVSDDPGHCGNLVADAGEQRGLRMILSMTPDNTFASIARTLDKASIPPRCGHGTWDRGVVRRIVRFYKTTNGKQLLAKGEQCAAT